MRAVGFFAAGAIVAASTVVAQSQDDAEDLNKDYRTFHADGSVA